MKPRNLSTQERFYFHNLRTSTPKYLSTSQTNISKQKQHERLDSLSIELFKGMTKGYVTIVNTSCDMIKVYCT